MTYEICEVTNNSIPCAHIQSNKLSRVWNAAEASGSARLRSKVLSVLDFRLEGFLAKDIFMFLGFEEIRQILCREALCIRSEKILFDSLAEWIRKKVLKNENDEYHEEETSLEIAAELLCLLKLDALPSQHLRQSLPSIRLPIRQSSKSSRKCEKCLYFFEYSRDEVCKPFSIFLDRIYTHASCSLKSWASRSLPAIVAMP